MEDRTDEILSAITLLSERIDRVDAKLGKLDGKLDRIELIVSEMAKKFLAPAECRALGITPPPLADSGAGTQSHQTPRAAKSR